MKKARVVVISSVSGGGKTSLIGVLTRMRPGLHTAITATSRPPRPGEENGVHYHFYTPEQFAQMIDAGEFVEYAVVHGNYYGIPRAPLFASLEAGRSVILNIDVQGMRHISEELGERMISVFIMPPSPKVWEERLRNRATDPEEVIRRRLEEGRLEIKAAGEYDYRVVNEVLEVAAGEVNAILEEEGVL